MHRDKISENVPDVQIQDVENKNVQMQYVGSNVRCTDERYLEAVPDVQI